MANHLLNPALLRTLVKPGAYPDGEGLYLRVRGPQQRAWAFRYMLRGKATWMGLGPYPDVGLAAAREKATAARQQAKSGTDPLADKRARQAAAMATEEREKAAAKADARTFRTAAEEYLRLNEGGWRNAKHAAQWPSTLATYVYPVIGDKPLAAVNTDDVRDVLQPIWLDKRETADRVRGRIQIILDWAAGRTDRATRKPWREGPNPALLALVKPQLPARRKQPEGHHAAMHWHEVAAFMADLARQEGVGALAMRFLILTATRTSETLDARWSEIDDGAMVWTIPASRTKTMAEHRVALSEPALAVLQAARELRVSDAPDAVIFPGRALDKPMSNMGLLMLLRRMKRKDVTVHGFRACFRTWCDDCTSYPRFICEKALGHKVGSEVERAYARSDLLEQRRKLMNDWARHCCPPPSADNVVALHSTAAA
jgi:integrase